MHPAQAVVSHSSRPQQHHHHFEDDRRAPPPYNPDDYSKEVHHPQQLGFEQFAQQQSGIPYVQQPMGPTYQYQQPVVQPPPPTVPINSVVITNQPYSCKNL
jgi:hypothetical protein